MKYEACLMDYVLLKNIFLQKKSEEAVTADDTNNGTDNTDSQSADQTSIDLNNTSATATQYGMYIGRR